MKVRRAALASLIVSLVLVRVAAADDDYSFCTVCHGAHGNGNPAINAPKIAGIEPWYLKRQLEHFRAGLRGTHSTDIPGSEMQPVALELDDAALQKVASYVSTFQPNAPVPTISGDVKRGRSLYATCAGCHGARAEGSPVLQAPALAGQSDWYLVTQLARFRAGERGFSTQDETGAQMRAATAVLPDDVAMRDVVAYINSLRYNPKRDRPRG
jgi:cytochrome c553